MKRGGLIILFLVLFTTSVSGICIDSDGGRDYSEYGVVTYDSAEFKDMCYTREILFENYCDEEEVRRIDEYSCLDIGKVCLDGICVDETSDCIDTDGGRNYRVSGITTTSLSEDKDKCSDYYILQEYYCEDGVSSFEEFDCRSLGSDYVCSSPEGACYSIPLGSCTDSDEGQNYEVQGTVELRDGSSFTDYCAGSQFLMEYFCSGDQVEAGLIKFDCASIDMVCSEEEGRCVFSPCIDYDGVDYYVQSIVTFDGERYEDVCYDELLVGMPLPPPPPGWPEGGNYLLEYSCDGSILTEGYFACESIGPGWVCLDGICVGPHGRRRVELTQEVLVEAERAFNAFRYADWSCYDGEEFSSHDDTSCKPQKIWQGYADDFCREHDGVEKFELSNDCYGEGWGGGGVMEISAKVEEQPQVEQLEDGEEYLSGLVERGRCDYGCLMYLEGKYACLSLGFRIEEKYCSIYGEMADQLEASEVCENNFECRSNVCIGGECISRGLLIRIFSWFRRFLNIGG